MTFVQVIMVLALTAAPPAIQDRSALAELSAAERRWSAAKIDAYEYSVRFTCGLCSPTLDQRVFQVRGAQSALKGAAEIPDYLRNFSSMDKVFAFIRARLGKKPLRVKIDYDEKFGYPRSVFIDPSDVTDDEDVFVVEGFTMTK